MIVKMIQDLRNRMEKMQEMFAKDLEELKNKQTEMNNTLEGINSRKTEAEKQILYLENRMVEIIAAEQNIEWKKSEENLRDIWDNSKHKNTCIKGILEEKKRKNPRKYLKR